MQGLNHNEVRTISEKVQEQPEHNNEREKRVEFRGAFKKNNKNSISMKGLVKKWTFFIKNFMTNYILAYPH